MSARRGYRVTLCGCDDRTEMDMDLTPDEYAFVKRLERVSDDTSSYGCQPVLTVEDLTPEMIEETMRDRREREGFEETLAPLPTGWPFTAWPFGATDAQEAQVGE